VLPAGLAGIENPGPHGFSEMLYAFVSATGNNGSAFAGLTASTYWYDTTLAIGCLIGRFLMIVPIMAIAGSLAAKKLVPPGPGSFPVSGGTFTFLLIGTVLLVGALNFLPALTLGPVPNHALRRAPAHHLFQPRRSSPQPHAQIRIQLHRKRKLKLPVIPPCNLPLCNLRHRGSRTSRCSGMTDARSARKEPQIKRTTATSKIRLRKSMGGKRPSMISSPRVASNLRPPSVARWRQGNSVIRRSQRQRNPAFKLLNYQFPNHNSHWSHS
jgi:hypothetical protein